MRNLYIFLTNSIRNVGGSQLYIANKTDWLESIGWDVQTFFYNKGNIIIDRLKRFNDNRLDFLSLDFCLSKKRDRMQLLAKIDSKSYNKIIIESHEVGLCLWGEFLAKELGGMNVCYPLSEDFHSLDEQRKAYLFRKLKDNLLWGIDRKSIPMLLGYSAETENRQLKAVGCTKICYSNEDYPLSELFEGQTIVCLSRLDKPFIMPMMHSVVSFVKANAKKRYNLILIGDAAKDSTRESVLNVTKGIDNLKVVTTGYLNPIPRKLLNLADVSIASSGCVVVTSNAGILTIAIDAHDYKAIGIYGVTTNNAIFRQNEPPIEISELIDDVLNKNKYTRYHKTEEDSSSIGYDYSEHYKIIEQYNPLLSYNVFFKLSLYEKIKKCIYILCGKTAIDWIGDFHARLKNCI